MDYKLDNSFPFDKITLANPSGLQGGSYFSKIKFEEDELLFQTPKCLTKNGIHKTGKKIYTDLQLTFDDSVFINWVENMEERIRDLIYEKRNIWFNNEPDREEIEYNWNSCLRTYKQKFQLLRVYVPKIKNSDQEQIQIWDEEQNTLNLDDIQSKNKLINIIEITGLKFTNQSFHLDFLLRQVMVFKEKKTFDKCLISLNNKKLEKEDNEEKEDDENIAGLENSETEDNLAKDLEKKDLEKKDLQQNMARKILLWWRKQRKNKKVSKDLEKKDLEKKDLQQNMARKILLWWRKKRKNKKASKDLEKTIKIPIHIKPLEQINEVDITIPVENEIMNLKKPEDVYLNIYKTAKKKAKEAKAIAIKAYLEAKRIKKIYLLDEIDSTDSESDEDFLDR
ncbi:MAG: hypothetical protein CML42_00595 [Rhodobacteraceae bacterium]|nr:hypothetical protein [Paracoccaceae bacterium]